MLGGDLTLSSPKLELNLQYVERRDKNPFFTLEPDQIATRGGFAELLYFPKGDDSRWYTAGIFNWVDSEQPDLNDTSRRSSRTVICCEEIFGRRLKEHMFLRASCRSISGWVWV